MVAAVVDAPLEVFVQLLEAGADPNHRDLGGFSALAWVVEKITELPSADKDPRGPTYRNEIVQLLIKFDADVNSTSLCKGPGLCDDECKTGCTKTPLHLALESSTNDGLLAVCQTLLKSGATLDSLVAVRAHDPNTLIEICKRRGHSRFQLELIKLTYRTDHEFIGERLANFDDPSSDGTRSNPLKDSSFLIIRIVLMVVALWQRKCWRLALAQISSLTVGDWCDGTIVAWLDEGGYDFFVNEHDWTEMCVLMRTFLTTITILDHWHEANTDNNTQVSL
jgi:hypothetical protein